MKYFQSLFSTFFRPHSLTGSTYAMSDFSSSLSHTPAYSNNNAVGQKKVKRFFKKSPFLSLIVVIIFVVLVAAVALKNVIGNSSTTSPSILSNDQRETIDKPKAQQVLNRSFKFPLKDATGKEVSQLQYDIQSVELRNEIIVKGQRATAIKGRTFLIVNLKITNSYDKSVQLNSKDYVRLIVGSSPEKLAADIHNDPVDVQAISTKYTRLGFPINDNETSLTLQVGEIAGKKELIPLNLK